MYSPIQSLQNVVRGPFEIVMVMEIINIPVPNIGFPPALVDREPFENLIKNYMLSIYIGMSVSIII